MQHVTSGLLVFFSTPCWQGKYSCMAFGIPKCLVREAIKNWTEMQHRRAWIDLPGLRHGKLYIGRPCKKRADDLS